MAPATYVVDDGLVGQEWKEKPYPDCPPPHCRGMSGGGKVGRGVR